MKTIFLFAVVLIASAYMAWGRGLWGDKSSVACEQVGQSEYSCSNDRKTMCEMGVVSRFQTCINNRPPKQYDECEAWMVDALKVCRK